MEGMELGIRGWMVIIGVLLILAVVLDGYRRMRNERYGNIKMSLKMGGKVGDNEEEIDELDMLSSELPNGGARIIPSDPLHTQDQIDEDALDPLFTEQPVSRKLDTEAITAGLREPEPELENESGLDTATQSPSDVEPVATAKQAKSPSDDLAANLAKAKQQATDRADVQPPAEEVVAVHAMAKGNNLFKGEDLLQILLACDCRFGEMNIFHRYEEAGAQGAREFSIANVLEPGTFDLDNIDSFNTPGVSFFLQLPGPKNPLQAYEYMIETAQCVAKNLGGELQDESRSIVTAQNIEHNRQRIREFERKRRLASQA